MIPCRWHSILSSTHLDQTTRAGRRWTAIADVGVAPFASTDELALDGFEESREDYLDADACLGGDCVDEDGGRFSGKTADERPRVE